MGKPTEARWYYLVWRLRHVPLDLFQKSSHSNKFDLLKHGYVYKGSYNQKVRNQELGAYPFVNLKTKGCLVRQQRKDTPMKENHIERMESKGIVHKALEEFARARIREHS